MAKQRLLNVIVDNVTMAQAVDMVDGFIEKYPATGKKAYVTAVNVDVALKAEEDDYLRKIIDEADLTIVDGQPLVWISRWQAKQAGKAANSEVLYGAQDDAKSGEIPVGPGIVERVTGSDLVPAVCELAAKKNYSVFLLGGAEGLAEKAKSNLIKKYGIIDICGTYAPPMGFETNEAELTHINAMINDSKPDILIACFGCPKQEKWIYENIDRYEAKVSICAGATMKFLAGDVSRAPKWVVAMGMEWFYRFLMEPKRLFKRYFVDDMKIFRLARKYR